MAVAFCISGHGFGHASRQVEVVNALGALRPDLPIALFTQASPWLLDRTVRVPVTRLSWAVDTGAIQRDMKKREQKSPEMQMLVDQSPADFEKTLLKDAGTFFKQAPLSMKLDMAPLLEGMQARMLMLRR